MRDWISTSRAGLFANPRFRNAPSLGQFFCRQYFEEWPDHRFIVLRLFSTHILCLHFSDLRCAAVRETAQLNRDKIVLESFGLLESF
jgi:hypothetical protein